MRSTRLMHIVSDTLATAATAATAARALMLLALALAGLHAFVPTAHANESQSPDLQELPVPAALLTALKAHYDIGRGTWDQGGVSRVESFSLVDFAPLKPGSKAYLTAVVQAVIAFTNQGGAADLATTCGVEPDLGRFEPLTDPAACASWHLDHATARNDARLAKRLGRILAHETDDTDDEARLYNDAIARLLDYVQPTSTPLTEILTTGADFGVDFYTVLMIDSARGVAHVVHYDLGA